MKIYNTLTRKIEEFVPNTPGKVNLYTCGPTVYHYAHIGNLRTYIMEDVLERGLKYLGYDVKRAMNITDVGHLTSEGDTGDDKMVKGAIRENKTVMEIAKYYTDEFFRDCDKLNIIKPEIIVPATDCIDDYIVMIKGLLEKEFAYLAGGNIYFDTSKLKDYYVLSNHMEENLIHGSREDVEIDNNKKNKTDFVLWFTKSKFDDQELKWESPWGIGYPGWHIECSGISLKYLGEHLDIHCGGVDNIFPHHTNEIAQTESFIGHKWCNYWFHSEFLNDKSGKMSKSKGETLTVSSLESKGYNPLSYRYFCLGSHYRKALTFEYSSLDMAENAYLKLRTKTSSLTSEGELQTDLFENYVNKMKETFANDINSAMMLTLIYEVLKDAKLTDNTKQEIINSYDFLLGLDLLVPVDKKELKIDEDYILNKIKERKEAKENKNYTLADEIRKELLDQGIILVDLKDQTIFKQI